MLFKLLKDIALRAVGASLEEGHFVRIGLARPHGEQVASGVVALHSHKGGWATMLPAELSSEISTLPTSLARFAPLFAARRLVEVKSSLEVRISAIEAEPPPDDDEHNNAARRNISAERNCLEAFAEKHDVRCLLAFLSSAIHVGVLIHGDAARFCEREDCSPSTPFRGTHAADLWCTVVREVEVISREMAQYDGQLIESEGASSALNDCVDLFFSFRIDQS